MTSRHQQTPLISDSVSKLVGFKASVEMENQLREKLARKFATTAPITAHINNNNTVNEEDVDSETEHDIVHDAKLVARPKKYSAKLAGKRAFYGPLVQNLHLQDSEVDLGNTSRLKSIVIVKNNDNIRKRLPILTNY